jgi:hypothetical protein
MNISMAKQARKLSAEAWYTIAILLVGLAVIAIGVTLLLRRPLVISTFAQCEKAGGAILTTYPEQCSIGGATFTNTAHQQPNDSQAYVGLVEEKALAKATEANTPARVVERDGEALPVTMDFVFGRLNFSVKNGVVYKVTVEGRE